MTIRLVKTSDAGFKPLLKKFLGGAALAKAKSSGA